MAFDPSTAKPEGATPFDPDTARLLAPSIGPDPGRRAPTGGLIIKPYNPSTPSAVINQRDDGIDYYSGVDTALFRAGFSRMTNDKEKSNFLAEKVGRGNYGKDSFGAWYIKPDGLSKLGVKSEIPISIDEQRMTRYDVLDFAGDLPALVGAAGGSLAATGYGAIPGMALTAIGAAGGKAYDELLKIFQGYSRKGPQEMAGTLAIEGAGAALGEGIGRGAGKLANFWAGKASPERQELTRQALDAGLIPKTHQIFDPGQAPLLTRFQGLSDRVLGDQSQAGNRAILTRRMEEFGRRAGEPVGGVGEKIIGTAKGKIGGMEVEASSAMQVARDTLNESLANIQKSLGSPDPAIGARIPEEIRAARRQFGDAASKLYAEVDDAVGEPFVPTAALKFEAERIASQLPKTEGGRVVFTKSGEANPIEDILNLPDTISLAQAQRIRTILREGTQVRDLAPGVDKRDLGLLKGASEKMFEDAGGSLGFVRRSSLIGPDGKAIESVTVLPSDKAKLAIEGLKRADAFYKAGIKKFDSPTIAAITREASQTGAVEPDRVLDYIIKPGYSSAAQRVKGLVSKETWGRVSRAHFDDLVESSKSLVGGEQAVVGRKLFDKVNGMGKTLEVVYGKDAPAIRRYAAELAALDGRLDPATLGGNNFAGSFVKSLEAAVLKQRRLDSFLKDNYLAQLAKPGKEAEQAVNFIFKPNSPQRISRARSFYGEGSEEFKGLQHAAMQKLLSAFVEKTNDPLVKVLNGASLKAELDHYGASTLKATFGEELTKDLYKFANLAEFITKKGPGNAGGIVAANVALHPIGNIGKIVDIAIASRLLRAPGVIRWLSEGIDPTTPANKAAAALAKVSTLAAVMLNDETGSASMTLTPPERPQSK